MARDFYDVLGVDRDASEEEINKAFRKKAARYHPDVSDEPDAEEQFKQIKKAKEVLTDEEQRQLYDRLGHDQYLEAEKHGATDNGGRGGARAGGPFGGGGGGDPFGSIFDQFFNQRSGGRQRPQQGRDLRTSMTIDLEEAFEGVTKRVTIRRPEHCDTCAGSGHPPDADSRTCPECNGRGQVTRVQRSAFGTVQRTERCQHCSGEGTMYSETCGECGGDGVVEATATLEVDVPEGIQSGQTLRMDGEGAPSPNGGPNGDLLIDVSVAEHPRFDRDGADLRLSYELSFPQAALGDRVTIETLDGEVELRIPAGTQPGDRFRLEGRGMPRLQRRGRGDLFVEADIVVPEKLSAEQQEAIEALAAMNDEDLDVDESLFDRIKGSF